MRNRYSLRVRLFLASWILFAVHAGTNVVREFYPAFSLIEHGSLRVDDYLGFDPDIFRHTNGHAYIGNNVAASYITAIPLLVFRPLLTTLDRYEKKRLASRGVPDIQNRNTDHPNSQLFFEKATQAGLTLRFGASTAIIALFLMAPLSAFAVVFLFGMLVDRGVPKRTSVGLALLFGFATPVFFRTGVLNHNMMMMYTTLFAFHLLWPRPGEAHTVSLRRRTWAGVLAGFGLALDYSGVVPLLALYGYLLLGRLGTLGWKAAIRESIPYILGSIPPVLFLLYTQWTMFGNPFLPGQFWMPDVRYSEQGFRGFSWPSLDLFGLNLYHPGYGMFLYGPILLLGLIPTFARQAGDLIFPTRERLFTILFFLALLTFCAANQYSRIQFNSGFRYMIPVVPLLFLALTDHLIRLPRLWFWVISIIALGNSWVISMVREPVPESWHRVLTEGPQLPWINTLRFTYGGLYPILNTMLLPLVVLTGAGVVAWWLLRDVIHSQPSDPLVDR